MAHALGIASRETIEEWRRHVDGPAVAEMMEYATRFRGGLSGRGWSELDVNRLYWGVRYFGSDFQMMQQALFANKTRQELKRKFCTEARRRPWLIDHALQGALDDRNATGHTVSGGPAGAPPDEPPSLPPLPPLPLPHMSKRGLDVVRGVATMCGDAADPSHPLNAPPPIPPEFVAASVRRAKARLRRMRDRERLARRDYAEHFPEAEPDPDDPSDAATAAAAAEEEEEEEGGDAAETVALGEDQTHEGSVEASVEASLEASHEASYGSEWSLASTSEGARNLHLDKPWRACAPAAVAPTAGANETSGGVGSRGARAPVETGAG